MTRDEARDAATRLQLESPERHRFTWMAREDDMGGWEVVKLPVRPRTPDLHTEIKPPPVRPHPTHPPPAEPRPWWGPG